MKKKKSQSNKVRPLLGGEEKSSDILAHKELAHEDTNLIYPFEPVKDGKGNTLYSEKQGSWKSDCKIKHKRK